MGIATDRHPGAPVVLLGHSGGALAAYLLAARHPETRGGAGAVRRAAAPRWTGWLRSSPARAPETEDLDPTMLLSTHPEYVHALMHDPLAYQGGFQPETLRRCRAWPEVAAALAAGRPDLPVLLVHGEEDPVVPVSDARSVAAALPHATLRVFPGDLHDVLNEHDRDPVHEEVVAFVDEDALAADPRLTASRPPPGLT